VRQRKSTGILGQKLPFFKGVDYLKKKNRNSGSKTSLGVLGTIVVLLLGKLKYVLVLVKVLKLQTLLSMVIYLGTYALFFGWKFAAAIVYLLFVHEMGHAYAAKRINLPVGPAIFIPFMGAVIGLKEMPKNAKDEGFVAYMGPLFGLLSFLPAFPLYGYTHEPFWALLIILGGMINLFNLIPITPLDGGRIAAGISTKLWGAGIVLLLVFSVIHLSFIGFLIVILGAREWYKLYKKQKSLQDLKVEVRELDQFVRSLKQEAHDLGSVQDLVRKTNRRVSHPPITELLNKMNTEIEKMKKDVYLQQLSGIPALSEEEHQEQKLAMDRILNQIEKELAALKKDVHTTETYYKTDKKTKVQLFTIYLALAAALAFSYYIGNQILTNHPDIQKVLNS